MMKRFNMNAQAMEFKKAEIARLEERIQRMEKSIKRCKNQTSIDVRKKEIDAIRNKQKDFEREIKVNEEIKAEIIAEINKEENEAVIFVNAIDSYGYAGEEIARVEFPTFEKAQAWYDMEDNNSFRQTGFYKVTIGSVPKGATKKWRDAKKAYEEACMVF